MKINKSLQPLPLNYLLKYFPQLTVYQREQFTALGPLYEEWNTKINVISRKDLDELYLRHVLHSLAIARVSGLATETNELDRNPQAVFSPGARILDIGTGGGFPAIPLAIMFPDAHFTAVDSIGKKIKVVEEISRVIGLKNLTPLNSRAENVPDKFDYVVSRAVAPAVTIIGWAQNKLEKGRHGALPNGFLLLKGGDLTQELADAKHPYTSYNISDWFDEEFFETKKVIHIAK